MHPKGVSPLSSGENTNSYKELLKMKKILSILLAMAMLISSITVAFVAFAADLSAEDLVEKINEHTTFVADANNADGTTHRLPGYYLIKTVSPSVSFDSDQTTNTMNSIMAAKYPEYSAKPYCVDGTYDFDEILKNLVGVDAVNAKVKKNSNASLTLGRDALIATKLNADDVTSVTTENRGKTHVLNYKDVDIVADEKVEDSILPNVTANYPHVTGLDDVIVNSAANHNTGLDFESFSLSISNIKIKVVFNSSNKITKLTYTYSINGSASLSYINPEPMSVEFTMDVSSEYSSFEYFNEGSDFDLAELAEKVNAGTANMVDTKAGYDYARNSRFEQEENEDGTMSDYTFSISSAGQFAPDSVMGMALGVVLRAVDKVTIGFDEKMGTHIRTDKWQCKNDTGENATDVCTADHPHQIWKCTCKDVAGCCTCCPAGTGCTSTHPCDKDGACRSVDCKCGYVDDPACKYVDNTNEKLNSFDEKLNSALTTVSGKLVNTMGTSAKEKLAIGATSANVPVATTATDKLDKRYAVKATELDVFDIESASFDDETGSIIFTLEDQNVENGYKALSHLTNDYVTNEQFVEALKLAAIDKLGMSIEAINGLFMSSSLVYSEITCTVKFIGATSDNVYGTGEIERVNLSYDCEAESSAIISYHFLSHMDSTAKNIEYADYELGDVNMDTKVSIADAQLVLRCIAEMETLNDTQKVLADMNEDGAVSIVDAKKILEKIANQTV